MKNATTVLTSNRDERQEIRSSRLTIQHRPVDTLRLDPLNPRDHSKKQIAQVAESIRAFGFNVPVLIDADNKIMAGHGRVLACQLLGITEIPTICLGHLSPEQVRAFIIADNKLTENATWNEILLGEQLKSLSEIDLNFSLEATGFEMGEIDVLIEGLSQPSDSVQEAPPDVLRNQSEILVSAPGDLWQLGKHRVLCGDALDPHSYDRLMTKQRATVVFTDPPCDLTNNGRASCLGEKQQGDFATAGGEMSRAECTDFFGRVCKGLVSASGEGAIHFLCMDWRHVGELLAAGREAYDELKNICVWVKDNASAGSLYRSQHQLILVFRHGKQSGRNSTQLRKFGRSRSDVWHYPGANSISRATEEGNLDPHPTGVPAALVADAILDCSSRGDIVLDPFLGSGTTVIAAERTGRICYGIEMDPACVDTAVRRWQRFTGMLALHGESGRSFDDLEKEATNARQRYKSQPVSGANQVGYRNPPEATRFKKGQSGNPKGRRKGSLNVSTVFAQTLREKVVVNENGHRKTMTKFEAAIKQFVNKAASGDHRALQLLVNLSREAETHERQLPPSSLTLNESDQKVIEGILKRFQTVTDNQGGTHDEKPHSE